MRLQRSLMGHPRPGNHTHPPRLLLLQGHRPKHGPRVRKGNDSSVASVDCAKCLLQAVPHYHRISRWASVHRPQAVLLLFFYRLSTIHLLMARFHSYRVTTGRDPLDVSHSRLMSHAAGGVNLGVFHPTLKECSMCTLWLLCQALCYLSLSL